MENTGERYLSEGDGDWPLEHAHRYLACRKFAKGKDVLDIARRRGIRGRHAGGISTGVFESVVFLESSQAVPAYGESFEFAETSAFPLTECSALCDPSMFAQR